MFSLVRLCDLNEYLGPNMPVVVSKRFVENFAGQIPHADFFFDEESPGNDIIKMPEKKIEVVKNKFA